MKRKKFVLVVTLVMILTSMIVPRNIEVEAYRVYGDPEIDYQYIFNKTANLSNIVKEDQYWNYSRYFGTDGERHAANLTKDWMEDIGLSNVKLEEIKGFWKPKILGGYEKLKDSA